MKEFTINRNDAGQRMDKFITKAMPALPTTLMYKYIRLKRIKLNGKRAEISSRLCVGDTVTAYISDEFFVVPTKNYDFMGAGDTLNIVYEDENILLADKPQGLLVHPDEGEYTDTLITRIQKYLYKKGEYCPDDEQSFKPALANRIDRGTGGLVIAAKNAESLRILCDKIKNREIDKRYLCIVHGTPRPAEATLEAYLEKNEQKNKVYLQRRKTDENLTIRTHYRVLESKNDLSLLEIELLTGRTHQIRAHMAHIGHPLLGDGKYGTIAEDKKRGYNRQALYSYKLTFSFASDAGILAYLSGKAFTVKEVWFAEKEFGYTL